jgi:hypothetical protein
LHNMHRLARQKEAELKGSEPFNPFIAPEFNSKAHHKVSRT